MKFSKSPPATSNDKTEVDDKVVEVKNDAAKDAKDEETKQPPFSNYWRILTFGTRLEHAVIAIAVIASAGSGVALPLINIVLGGLAGNFNAYFIPGNTVTQDEFKRSVASSALYIVYLAIAKFVLTYIARFGFRIMGLRISASLRLSYLEALFAQRMEKLDRVSSGTIANTITSSANIIQLSISDRLASLFQSLALIITAYAIAFKYSWALTLVVSSAILFVLLVYGVITPSTIKAQQRVEKADEKHATVAAEAVSSIRTVSALNAEPKMILKHARWVNESHAAGMRMAKHMGGQLAPIYFAIYASFALAFWYGLKLYQDGKIKDVGTVLIVFFSVLIVTSVLGAIVQPVMEIIRAVTASSTLFEMIDSERVDATGLREPEVSALGDIELRDINFAYPSRSEVQVLHNFQASFEAGKTTALVGPSGSGKSTIVALLERWYELGETVSTSTDFKGGEEKGSDPSKGKLNSSIAPTGQIITSGHNINDFDIKWWRTQVGLVQQEPFLFNDTIENNVAYGLLGTPYETADPAQKLQLVKEACQEAFADEFISKLPKGYASQVGEAGIKLSGGQRQRLAIARSIIRKPAILILDEATSAIDVRSEKIVQEALDRASRNRTTIVIAHRLSTIRKADKIIVLRSGTKFEEGTHEQLMGIEDGLYRGLVRSQHLEEEQIDTKASEGTSADEMNPIHPIISLKKTRTHSYSSARVGEQDVENVDSMKKYKLKGFFESLGLIMSRQRAHWLLYAILLLAAAGGGTGNALQSWFFAQLIQAFTYTGQRLVQAQNFWALMFFVLALSVATSYGFLGVFSSTIATHVGTDARRVYFKNTLRMPITYFDRDENASGSVMQRLSTDPKQLQELMGIQSAFPLVSILAVVGSAIVSFYFGWKLTLVTFFAIMPLIIMSSFIRIRQEFTHEKKNAKVFAESSQFATEAVGAFRTVSSLAMEDFVIEKYRRLLKDQIRTSTRNATWGMLIYAFSESIELCGMALTFWYGGQLLASREYNPFQFFIVYSAIILGAQQAGQSLSVTTNIALSTAAANRIFKLQEEADDSGAIDTSDATVLLAQADIDGKAGLGAGVEFKNVSFSYSSNRAPLFSGLNISILPGQFVAFVGPSGCGKTTTVSLLQRFYDPTSGAISVDGQEITSQDVRIYRQGLALVSQEPRLFSGTIRQNLLIGVPDESSVTEDRIYQACRDAEIHDFIISLPSGYDTDLGQSNTTSLSGGQKQRLCLARALLRRPRLLLLDEATSSLDSQSERLVQGAIERLAGERAMTVIAVAHRLATIQKADVIYVFGERDVGKNRGSRIVEKGSHHELLAKRGMYWSMCQAQSLDR